MGRIRWLSAIALLAACNERGLPAAASGASGPGPQTMTTVQSTELCLTDGEFDFHVYGDGLAAWEGKRIAASAIETHSDFSDPQNIQHSTRRPVQLDTRISGGSFSIMCPSSLRPNNEYPSYAVFIDVDGDGKCGGSDIGLQMQLYAWDRAVDDHIGISFEWESFLPVAQLQGELGDQPHSFCQDYFP
jgi:hypothetical protein